ncbi:MAG TPA: hypothetical protein DCQ31_01380, partial [Bacteroidales bacterium]|nr:hypothetical protein [Bacteroidales bacterium]
MTEILTLFYGLLPKNYSMQNLVNIFEPNLNITLILLKMKPSLLLLLLLFFSNIGYGQIVINEGSNSNYTQIADEKDDFPDWIELYNSGSDKVLAGYYLSDSKSDLKKWAFPSVTIYKNNWLLIYASGTVVKPENNINHWETAIKDNDVWKWINPTAETSTNWKELNFNDSDW